MAPRADRKPQPMDCPEGHVVVRVIASQVVRYDQFRIIRADEWEDWKAHARVGDDDSLNACASAAIDTRDVLDADDIDDADVVRVDPRDVNVVVERLPDEGDEEDPEFDEAMDRLGETMRSPRGGWPGPDEVDGEDDDDE